DLKISLIPEKVNQFFKTKITNILSKFGTENSTAEMTQESILAQSLIILLSGFDTTSTLLCFAAYLLATDPEIQTRLQKEVDSALKNQEVTYDVVKGIKYLDMVLSETLRLHPPAVSTDRICVKRYGLDAEPGIELKPGDHVLIPIYGLHRDPKHFPQPERFDPERFSDQNRHKIKPFTYMPFGQGPRCCLGTDFAKMQVKLLLVHLLAHYNFKVISKTPVPLKLVHIGFNLTADKGFWLGLEKRTS
ncbi:Cytochrome P450 9e2, partial [Blattella germanica]